VSTPFPRLTGVMKGNSSVAADIAEGGMLSSLLTATQIASDGRKTSVLCQLPHADKEVVQLVAGAEGGAEHMSASTRHHLLSFRRPDP
jgi:hypothetical protein